MAAQERVPLLNQDDERNDGHQVVDALADDEQDVRQELLELMRLAAPACVQLIAQQGMIITNQVFAGHLGTTQLAAASIGMTWFNLLWYFLLGNATSVDTLASQAFGAGDRPAVVGWCVSAVISISMLCVPMSVALVGGKWVAMNFFRQPEDIADMIGSYCQWYLPGLWPFVWSLILMKGMQAQKRMWIPAIATAITAIANIPINILLIQRFGFLGAAMSNSAARILQLFILLGCIAIKRDSFSFARESQPQKKSLPGQDALTQESDIIESTCKKQRVSPMRVLRAGASWAQLRQILRLGLPGGVMMAADAGAFEVTTAMAGILGTIQVDAHTTVMAIANSTYLALPFGVSTAATIRVGNLLGAGKPNQARISGFITIAICMVTMFVCGGTFFLCRKVVGTTFVNNKDVAKMVEKIAVVVFAYQTFDGLFAGTSGVLRGMGRQAELMIYCVTGFWGFGVLLGGILTFKLGWGLTGLWLGITTGVLATAAFCSFSYLRADWQEESRRALQSASNARARQEAEEEEHTSLQDAV